MIIITDQECEAVPGSGISERVIFPEQRPTLEIMYAAMLRLEGVELAKEELRKISYEQASRILLVEQEHDVARMRIAELAAENESLREQLRIARSNEVYFAEGVLRLKEQLRTARAEIFLDEIDAAKAGEDFLVKESENVRGRVILYPDVDTSAKQPRVKTVCLFDKNDVLRAAFMLTRDIFNRTQLSTIRALGDAEPQNGEGE